MHFIYAFSMHCNHIVISFFKLRCLHFEFITLRVSHPGGATFYTVLLCVEKYYTAMMKVMSSPQVQILLLHEKKS